MDWSDDTYQKLSRCEICPRRCGADRANGETGLCGASLNVTVARAAPHFWEEPCISGVKGSGAVFFCGCPLKCVFCQNDAISHGGRGKALGFDALCETLYGLIRSGVHNLNLVTPTHYSCQIRDVLRAMKPDIPVIFNCGGYERVETLASLDGLVDVYLPDFKYPSADYAKTLCARADYTEAALPALAEMQRQVGCARLDENGLIRSGLIIRHLVLPGRTAMSKKVLDIIKANFTAETMISLMGQYIPAGPARNIKGLDRKVSKAEYDRVAQYLCDLGFENGYLQEGASADGVYVPAFDLCGVAGADHCRRGFELY